MNPGETLSAVTEWTRALPVTPPLDSVARKSETPSVRANRTPNPWLTSILLHLVLFSGISILVPEVVRSPSDQPVEVTFLDRTDVERTVPTLPPATVAEPSPPEIETSELVSVVEAPVFALQDESVERPPQFGQPSSCVNDPGTSGHGGSFALFTPVPVPVPVPGRGAGSPGGGSGNGGEVPGVIGTGGGEGWGSASGDGYGTGQGRGGDAALGVGTGTQKAGPPGARGGVTRSARPKGGLSPSYPESQRRAGRESSVLLEVLVGIDGRAQSVRVLTEGLAEDFIRSAVSAAKSARYETAMENGLAVPAYFRLRVDYKLR